MPALHNRINNEELKQRMLAEAMPRTTVSFYKYFSIPDPHAFRDSLYLEFFRLQVFGRIYIAHEGINGQVSVPAGNYEQFRDALYQAAPELNGIRMNKPIYVVTALDRMWNESKPSNKVELKK